MTTTGMRLPTLSIDSRISRIRRRWCRMTFDEEDCGFQMLYCDEIVTSVQEESDSVDDKMEEEENNNNESSKDPSNADAFSALETAMEYY
ncbi:hypothetical protein TNCV_2844761 [Trichonephila clavipes]|nr:hypothetical protein TNCV_2844761 [Trichonephila clavipes]